MSTETALETSVEAVGQDKRLGLLTENANLTLEGQSTCEPDAFHLDCVEGGA